MADESYPLGGQGVYRKQGGKELVVGSSGTVTVESGGQIVSNSSDNLALHSGGLTIGTSGTVAFSSGAKMTIAVTAGTTAANLPNSGLSTIAATSAAGAQVFTLDAPIAGQRKTILCTVANNTDTCTVFSGTAVSMSNTTTAAATNRYKFVAPGCVELIGVSTAHWAILTPNVSTVAYSTS